MLLKFFYNTSCHYLVQDGLQYMIKLLLYTVLRAVLSIGRAWAKVSEQVGFGFLHLLLKLRSLEVIFNRQYFYIIRIKARNMYVTYGNL